MDHFEAWSLATAGRREDLAAAIREADSRERDAAHAAAARAKAAGRREAPRDAPVGELARKMG